MIDKLPRKLGSNERIQSILTQNGFDASSIRFDARSGVLFIPKALSLERDRIRSLLGGLINEVTCVNTSFGDLNGDSLLSQPSFSDATYEDVARGKNPSFTSMCGLT